MLYLIENEELFLTCHSLLIFLLFPLLVMEVSDVSHFILLLELIIIYLEIVEFV